MAWRCEVCGKASGSGHNVSFSERKTNRRFRPNIQSATLIVNGEPKSMRVCTRCLRTHYKGVKTA